MKIGDAVDSPISPWCGHGLIEIKSSNYDDLWGVRSALDGHLYWLWGVHLHPKKGHERVDIQEPTGDRR